MQNWLLTIIFLISATVGHSQKLPKVQQESVYAPVNIKIDGTAAEWSYKYKAFDLKNNIFYTISNDDKNLYLIVHTSEPNTINKIYCGGISFIITSANR